jgi:hypothetical protein
LKNSWKKDIRIQKSNSAHSHTHTHTHTHTHAHDFVSKPRTRRPLMKYKDNNETGFRETGLKRMEGRGPIGGNFEHFNECSSCKA